MHSKLAKLEAKLETIHREDLQQLEVESSDATYLTLLDNFIKRFADTYKITEQIGEVREIFVLTLLLKLESLLAHNRLLTDANNRDIAFLICETLRICFREPLALKKIQVENFLLTIIRVLTLNLSYELSTAAARLLINVLNQSEDRILLFLSISVGGLKCLTDLLDNGCVIVVEKLTPEFAAADDKGSQSQALSNRGSFRRIHCAKIASGLSYTPVSPSATQNSNNSTAGSSSIHHQRRLKLLLYLTRILLMSCHEGERIRRELRERGLALPLALVKRLSLCLTAHHHDYDHTNMIYETTDNKNETANTVETTQVKLEDFPYDENSASLFADLIKLLYALDPMDLINSSSPTSSKVELTSRFFTSITLPEDSREVQAVDWATLHALTLQSSVEEISVHLLGGGNSSQSNNYYNSSSYMQSRAENCNLINNHSNSSYTYDNNNSSPSKGNDLARAIAASRAADSKTTLDSASDSKSHYKVQPMSKEAESVATEDSSSTVSVPPITALILTLATALTVGPLHCGLRYDPLPAAPYYAGRLYEAEEAAVMLAMLLPSEHLPALFFSNTSDRTSNTSANRNGTSRNNDRLGAPQRENEPEEIRLALKRRRPLLVDSLARILQRLLARLKLPGEGDKAALISPILILLTKASKAEERVQRALKKLVFPTSYDKERHGGLNKKKNMDPTDKGAPGCLRFELLFQMTSLDSTIKRLAAELLFVLCDNDGKNYFQIHYLVSLCLLCVFFCRG